jgi:hypothetical protein
VTSLRAIAMVAIFFPRRLAMAAQVSANCGERLAVCAAWLRTQRSHVDPRHGITDYGPADAASTAVRTIRCGVVGTPQAIDGLRRWLDRCRQPIPGKKSRLARLFMPFPGFDTSAGFRSTLIFDSRLERPLRDRDLTNLASLNPAKAVRSAVGLYMEELSILNEEPGCDVVLIARPDDLPEGIQEAGPRRGRRSRGGPAAEDFRAQLKAEAMRHSHPLQLIRRTTWDPAFRPPDAKGRSLQDEATRAWNLHTALYYKAGGVPWRLPRRAADLTTCYVGVSFYRTIGDDTLQTSVAQVFNERGDGMIIRGAPAHVSRDDRRPHLTAEHTGILLAGCLSRYRKEHHTSPARLVLHKSSSYTTAEMDGFRSAADKEHLHSLELLWIPGGEAIRLFRHGQHPPLRGTMLSLDDQRHLLYTHGSVPFYGTYPGLYVPVPLAFRAIDCESSPDQLARNFSPSRR